MTAAEQHGGPRTALSIIRDLKSGRLSGSSLARDDRQRCVEHLTAEGYTTAEIAEVLGVCERTIGRDRPAIRSANALERDPRLVGEVVGRLVQQAEASVARCRRIGREKDAPPSARVDAERTAWTVSRELVETLQKLGYLPTAAQEFRGELTHRVETSPEAGVMSAEIARLEQIVAASASADQELIARLEDAKRAVTALHAEESVRALQEGAAGLADPTREVVDGPG